MKKIRIALAVLCLLALGMTLPLPASALEEYYSEAQLEALFKTATANVLNVGTKVEYHINLNHYFEEKESAWISSNEYSVPWGQLPPGMSLEIVEQSDMIGKPSKLELRGTPTKTGTYESLVHVYGSVATSGHGYAGKHLWVKFRINVGETKEKYDLWVDGIQVTDTNRDNILGAFTYDPVLRVLTVHKDHTSRERVMIRSQVDDLTILSDEDVTLSARFTVFELEADTTIAGPGFLTLKSQESYADWNAQVITVADGSILTFQGAALEIVNQRYYSYGIRGFGTGARVIFRDSAALIKGSMGAVTGFAGGISMEGSSVLKQGNIRLAEGCIGKSGLSGIESEVIIESVSYDLWIEDEQVTPTNRTSLLDGALVYDPGSRTLTVKKDVTQEWPVPMIRSEIDGLTIRTDGDVTLGGLWTVLDLRGNTTLTGSGKLTVTTSGGTAVSVSNGAALTIDGLTADVRGKQYGFHGGGSGKLVLNGADVTAGGGTAAISAFASSGGITFDTLAAIVQPKDGKVLSGQVTDKGGNAAKEARIRSKLYDLWVDGQQVSPGNRNKLLDGAMTYDPSTKTLRILKDCQAADPDSVLLRSEVPGLTIEVTEQVSLSDFTVSDLSRPVEEWAEKKPCIVELRADTTVTGGGTLTTNQFPFLVSNGATLTVDGSAGLNCGSPTNGLMGDGAGKLVVGRGTVEGAGRKDHIFGFTDIVILYPGDTAIDIPENGKIIGGAVRNEDGSIPKNSARIRQMKTYDLSVCGTQVTDWNAGDVLGDGVFCYDPDHNTLHVMGDCKDETFTIIQSGVSDLIISADRDCELALSPFAMGFVIDAKASTIITGPGKLTLTGSYNAPLAMNSTGDLTIRDADLVLTGEDAALQGTGAWNPNRLIVENSMIQAVSKNTWKSAVTDFRGGIELIDCMILTPAGGFVDETGRIVDGGGVITNSVDIRPVGIRVNWNEMTYATFLPGSGKAKLIAAWVAEDGRFGGCKVATVNRGKYIEDKFTVTANYSNYYLYAVDAKTCVPLIEPYHLHFDLK